MIRKSRDQGALDAPIPSQSRKAQNCYLAMAAMRPDPPRGSDGRAIAKFAAVQRNRADRMARNRMQHCSVGVIVRQETSIVAPLSNSIAVPLGCRGFSLSQARAP